MKTKTSKNYVDKLKAQREKLDARIQAAEARTKSQERKRDTRRKILVGSYYLEEATKNNGFDDLKKKMDGYLTRDSDRKLFELMPKEENNIGNITSQE